MEDVTSDVIMVMRTTLSKKEFASALGMSDTDVFVLKMFNIVDRDGDGRISFQEFLDTIVLFSKVSFWRHNTTVVQILANRDSDLRFVNPVNQTW